MYYYKKKKMEILSNSNCINKYHTLAHILKHLQNNEWFYGGISVTILKTTPCWAQEILNWPDTFSYLS